MRTIELVVPEDRPDHGYGDDHRRASPLHDWRVKSLVQGALSRLPGSERLNYVFQRHVTRTLPIGDRELVGQVGKAVRNVAALQRWVGRPLRRAHLYEYGVGWDLLMPLAYWCMGVERQTVIDLAPLARPDLIRDAADRLKRVQHSLQLTRSPVLARGERSAAELAASLGIEYRAPADAQQLDADDGSFDMVSSCDVLEHVPPAQIVRILSESRRILRDDGIMRARIDYQDHYWYFDSRISPYNFLKFADGTWRKHNPSLHYQNRLRHDDFLSMFTASGWSVVEDDHAVPSRDDLRTLATLKLAPRYQTGSPERLAIRFANFTLKKRDAGPQ